MKVIIAGSRGVTLEDVGAIVARSGFDVTEVVSGGATGADALGVAWAEWRGIPVRYFRPDWGDYGKAAGPMRNKKMAEYGDALIAICDGQSRGTRSMIAEAKRRGMPTFVETVENPMAKAGRS